MVGATSAQAGAATCSAAVFGVGHPSPLQVRSPVRLQDVPRQPETDWRREVLRSSAYLPYVRPIPNRDTGSETLAHMRAAQTNRAQLWHVFVG